MKRDNALQQVVYMDDDQPLSECPTNEDSATSGSDRSVAGDNDDIDWMHYLLQSSLPEPFEQRLLAGASRATLGVVRHGRNGINVAVQDLETLWHAVKNPDGPFASLAAVCAYQKQLAQQHRPACAQDSRPCLGPNSGLRAYLSGEEMAVINEGIGEYGSEPVAFQSVPDSVFSFLRGSPKYAKSKASNTVFGWVDQINQNKILDPFAFYPCACGYKVMDEVLEYRKELEPNYPTEETCTSLFELNCHGMDELDDDYDLKEQMDASFRTETPPRCRDIIQHCDIHAIPTNSIWILLDSSAGDVKDQLAATNSSLPAPGMLAFTSYAPDFRITPGFMQVSYETLPPRCKHGHLHRPAFEFCLGCFPTGQHYNCVECEDHPILQKPMRRDFTLNDVDSFESGKLAYDQKLFITAYEVVQRNEWCQ